MKSAWTGFRSPLGPGITAFLAHKRALGCLFRVEEMSLRLVDRFLVEQGIASLDAITADIIDAFLASRPRHAPRSYNHLRGTLTRLFDWLAAHEMFASSPVRAKPRRSTWPRLPFLFDDTTARRLLDATSKRHALRQTGTLNPRPARVTDALFADRDFFDPHDLLQVHLLPSSR